MFRVLAQVTNPFPQVGASTDTINIILNIVFAILGAIALLFIVIGGFKFIISNGDPQATSRARDTIIYAAVGLVIVLSATIIVNFVVGKL